MNQSRSRGFLRLRHLGEVVEAKGEEMAEERQRFHALAREDAAPRVVSSFNLFQTPEPLAGRLVAMFGGRSGRWLEPSAGLGRIYRAIRAADPLGPVVLVDDSPDCCRELWRQVDADPLARLVHADFLECGPNRLGGLFDCIAMNPPFKQGRDIKHIVNAQKLLCPGGRLVALCANGPRQRERLQPLASHWEELPDNSFASEGTRVAAALLVIDASE